MPKPSIVGTNVLWRPELKDGDALTGAHLSDRSKRADATLRLLARSRGAGLVRGLDVAVVVRMSTILSAASSTVCAALSASCFA